jgi:hypothetical protein
MHSGQIQSSASASKRQPWRNAIASNSVGTAMTPRVPSGPSRWHHRQTTSPGTSGMIGDYPVVITPPRSGEGGRVQAVVPLLG